MQGRRDELAEAAAEYVLQNGLAGVSLRPLAAAIGTSDRMLVYHFGDKDSLVAEALELINNRVVGLVSDLPVRRSVRSAVLSLWEATTDPIALQCLQAWLQAAGLGLLGAEPYRSSTRRCNALWLEAISGYLRAAGASGRASNRAARLVSATMMGLHLDRPAEDDAHIRRSVRDLAEWVDQMCRPPG